MNRTKKPSDSADALKSIIAQLDNKDREIRINAHKSLVNKGESAVRLPVEALSNPSDRVRWETGKILDEINLSWSNHADKTTISSLINDLGSQDGLVRVRARRALVTIGAKTVTALEEVLKSKDLGKRWEAAKALGQIKDPRATEALIRALEDEMFDVRWLAAEGLIAIGRPVLVPLMRRLTKETDSYG
jgi:HEAT repeat protein